MEEKLLEIKNLKTCFYTNEGIIPAVDNISFDIKKGETIAIVGESGSGKSITALSILNSIPSPFGKIKSGEIIFDNQDLLKKSKKEIQKIKGNSISLISQEPMTALNPILTIGKQISEVLKIHKNLNKKESLIETIKLLKLVGIPDAKTRINEYPHQISGGMRQRVMIAMALSCNPKLLIADEPTTALDVTIQAQILDIMEDLKEKFNMSILMITHDLGIVAQICQRVIVMYAGEIVEIANVMDLFKNPKHPYTKALLLSMPSLAKPNKRLNTINGSIPKPTQYNEGCRFYQRCEYKKDKCKTTKPPIINKHNRTVSCWIEDNDCINEVII
ncbi:MAG: ABC transporter ATP-binding protein [Peptostreptococcaceae bacterium]|jgi:oligopeptide/dipeptide ABC transporter ATP-binding protein|nr:ABC transporter ATP-binding protein [Peptostreptococcaceae bacterium]